MIDKQVLPESFDFGVPSVELVEAGRKGLDKTAMVKRASAFEDILEDLKPKPNRTYLHVITTGGGEWYGPNLNSDLYNEASYVARFPHPEDPKHTEEVLDGGLMKYHDDEYMKNGAVYQEHKTKKHGVEPSGEIVSARYNKPMHRGELIIAVDTEKWAPRLERKAKGQDIYLSIGCSVDHDTCFPAGTLIHTATGYKPIEDIKIGDFVYADDNTLHPVTDTMMRQTRERMRVDVEGVPLEIECTPNHPFLCADVSELHSCWGSVLQGKAGDRIKIPRRHSPDMSTGKCLVCGKKLQPELCWRPAEDLKYRDFLVAKIEQCNDKDTVGVDFAYLCGQYVGDGCLLKTKSGHNNQGEAYTTGISISASAAEQDSDILERIKLAYHNITGRFPAIRHESNNKNAYVVECADQFTAVRIHEGFGAGSRTKHVSAVHGWSRDERLAFLGGYIDSDGCVDKSDGAIRISTINRGLALDVQKICWSVGIPAYVHVGSSIQNLSKSAYGASGPCYSVYLPYSIDKIKRYSAKTDRIGGDFNTRAHFSTRIVMANGYVLLPVIETRRFACPEYTVYNLEVADRHAYYAEGVIVHNCNVCGHHAKTMDEHCDHFKKMRNMVLEDGTRCYVINDAPKFYDISGVDVPADRIAFVLNKVASGASVKEASVQALMSLGYRKPMLFTKAATILDKLSRMEKKITAMVDDGNAEAYMDDIKVEKDFPPLVENWDADEVIDSCSRKGILLSPGLLFKVLGRECEDPADQAILCSCDDGCCGDCSTIIEDLDNDEDRNDILMDGSFDAKFPVDLTLDRILEDFVPELGCSDPAINAKIIRITVTGREPKPQTKEAKFNKTASQALRNVYARYLISFAERNDDATCWNALRKCAHFGK